MIKIYQRDRPTKQISHLIKTVQVPKPKLIRQPKLPAMPKIGQPMGMHPHYKQQ